MTRKLRSTVRQLTESELVVVAFRSVGKHIVHVAGTEGEQPDAEGVGTEGGERVAPGEA